MLGDTWPTFWEKRNRMLDTDETFTKKRSCKSTYKRISKSKNREAYFFGHFQISVPWNLGFNYNIHRCNISHVSSIMLAPVLNLLRHIVVVEYKRIIPLNVHLLICCIKLYTLLEYTEIYYFCVEEIDVPGWHNHNHWLKTSRSLLVLFMPEFL